MLYQVQERMLGNNPGRVTVNRMQPTLRQMDIRIQGARLEFLVPPLRW